MNTNFQHIQSLYSQAYPSPNPFNYTNFPKHQIDNSQISPPPISMSKLQETLDQYSGPYEKKLEKRIKGPQDSAFPQLTNANIQTPKIIDQYCNIANGPKITQSSVFSPRQSLIYPQSQSGQQTYLPNLGMVNMQLFKMMFGDQSHQTSSAKHPPTSFPSQLSQLKNSDNDSTGHGENSAALSSEKKPILAKKQKSEKKDKKPKRSTPKALKKPEQAQQKPELPLPSIIEPKLADSKMPLVRTLPMAPFEEIVETPKQKEEFELRRQGLDYQPDKEASEPSSAKKKVRQPAKNSRKGTINYCEETSDNDSQDEEEDEYEDYQNELAYSAHIPQSKMQRTSRRLQPKRSQDVKPIQEFYDDELQAILDLYDDLESYLGFREFDQGKLYALFLRSEKDRRKLFVKLKRNLAYYKKNLRVGYFE